MALGYAGLLVGGVALYGWSRWLGLKRRDTMAEATHAFGCADRLHKRADRRYAEAEALRDDAEAKLAEAHRIAAEADETVGLIAVELARATGRAIPEDLARWAT